MRINEFSNAQRVQRFDRIANTVLFIVGIAACVASFAYALDVRAQRNAVREELRQARSDERLARTGSRLCYDDGREVDPLHIEARPLTALTHMSIASCRD